MTLLDTSALIDYLVDGPLADAAEHALAEGSGAVSAISVYELLAGVTSPKHRDEREELLRLMPVLPVTMEIGRHAAVLYTELRSRGVTVDNEDLIIAATALAEGLPVLTADRRHMQEIPGLQFV